MQVINLKILFFIIFFLNSCNAKELTQLEMNESSYKRLIIIQEQVKARLTLQEYVKFDHLIQNYCQEESKIDKGGSIYLLTLNTCLKKFLKQKYDEVMNNKINKEKLLIDYTNQTLFIKNKKYITKLINKKLYTKALLNKNELIIYNYYDDSEIFLFYIFDKNNLQFKNILLYDSSIENIYDGIILMNKNIKINLNNFNNSFVELIIQINQTYRMKKNGENDLVTYPKNIKINYKISKKKESDKSFYLPTYDLLGEYQYLSECKSNSKYEYHTYTNLTCSSIQKININQEGI